MNNDLEDPSIGHFEYGPDASNTDFALMFDNIKIRSYTFPAPLVSPGKKQYSVEIGNQACENVQVLNAGNIQCHVHDVPDGIVEVKVINPDGEFYIFELTN